MYQRQHKCTSFRANEACATDETKLWLSLSAKQRRNPCSVPPVVYQDLSTLHDWPAKEPWPIYETHFCNWLSPLEPRARIPALVRGRY